MDTFPKQEKKRFSDIVFSFGNIAILPNSYAEHKFAVLTWALYLIATHPDVEQKILEEVQNVLGDKDESYDTMKDLV